MPSKTFVSKCPKCGSHAVELTAFSKAKENDMLRCPDCGHRARKSEFVADVLNKAAKQLQDAFRDIPGFKPKR